MNEFSSLLIKQVRALAQERPNYSDETRCRYFSDGQPSCIIGYALSRMGLPDEVLDLVGQHNDQSITSLNVHMARSGMEYSDSPEAVRWLGVVQTYQDKGSSWSQAVSKADRLSELDQAVRLDP